MTEKQFYHVCEEPNFELDSTASIFLEVLANHEIETGSPFSLAGSFVRDNMLGIPYKDFDVCIRDQDVYRHGLYEQGLIQLGENMRNAQRDPEGRPHDVFYNPYDIKKTPHFVRFIKVKNDQAYPHEKWDFSINEFALKSDGLIHAPTYAWRDLKKRIIRLNPNAKMITNLFFRAVRLAAKLDGKFSTYTKEKMDELAALPFVSDFRAIYGMKKIIEDGNADLAFQILESLSPVFYPSDKYHSLEDLIKYHEEKIFSGQGHREGREPAYPGEGQRNPTVEDLDNVFENPF